MRLASVGLSITGLGGTLPRIEGCVHLPGLPPLPIEVRPQVLYRLPRPERGFHALLKRHARWCALHKGITTLAAWRQIDLSPWRFFGTELLPGPGGTVKPLDLPQLEGQLGITLRFNAHLVPVLTPHELRLYYKEAVPRKERPAGSIRDCCRYYPAERWQPKPGPLTGFHTHRTRAGRWLICECLW
jgi:hypothetical protein